MTDVIGSKTTLQYLVSTGVGVKQHISRQDLSQCDAHVFDSMLKILSLICQILFTSYNIYIFIYRSLWYLKAMYFLIKMNQA